MTKARAEDSLVNGAGRACPVVEIDRMFREHAPTLRGLCRYLLGSRDAAEDAVGEVYLKARQTPTPYDLRQPFSRWIMSIARHHCIDVLRRRRIEARLFAPQEIDADRHIDALAPRSAPLAGVLDRESRETVRAAVERLPPHYRVPLVLRYYEELSYDEIASELNLTRQEVATLLFRAKQKLRATLPASVAPEGA